MDIHKIRKLLPDDSAGESLFVSTRDRDGKNRYHWNVVLERGLSPDYGLFMPATLPRFTDEALSNLANLTYPEIAWLIMRNFLPQNELPDNILAEICEGAYSETHIPLEYAIDDNSLVIARLDRGPSCSFKDFAARFLARLMSHYLSLNKRHATIIVATSGDTGTAIQTAFYGLPHTSVLVLYPADRVSEVQEKQMLSIKDNVRAIPVAGNFDDCQRLAKSLLSNDSVRERFNLTSANSISVWRLLPQSVYYFYIWAELNRKYPDQAIIFSVPSGNLGNLTAGLIAKRMGLPVKMFIAGTNANNIFANIVGKGTSSGSLSNKNTLANSMDISIPSNLERILFLYGETPENIPDILSGTRSITPSVAERLRQDVFSEDIITNEDIEAHIVRFWRRNNIVLEPHGVIGVAASFRYRQYFSGDRSVIAVLETASPSKFPDFQKTYPDIPIQQCASLKKLVGIDLEKIRPQKVAAEPDAIVRELETFIRQEARK
ncbi:MAG: threonine synthase [Nitrospiraceae bacterium]|nr:MAG: threonine synthase [Nitrospiraceae bacterium]